MVGNYTHRNVYLCVVAIFLARNLTNSTDYRLEYVGVVVRLFALKRHTETLEAHTGVNYFGRQFLEVSVGHTVILHKYKVPNLNNLRV